MFELIKSESRLSFLPPNTTSNFMNDKFQTLDSDDDVLWFYTNNKVRVQARIVNSYCENDDKTKYNKAVIDICIEFCPDRPTEPTPFPL